MFVVGCLPSRWLGFGVSSLLINGCQNYRTGRQIGRASAVESLGYSEGPHVIAVRLIAGFQLKCRRNHFAQILSRYVHLLH